MNKSDLSAYFAKIGAKGGKASKRVLTPEQARAMQLASTKARLKKGKLKK